MKSGANYIILRRLDIDTSQVDKIIFAFKSMSALVTKEYPGEDVTEKDKLFSIKLYQEDTITLKGDVSVEAQINFKDGAVGKTAIDTIHISNSVFTELVEGNNPTGTTADDVTFEVVGDVIIGKIVGDVDPEIIERAVQDYLEKHPVQPYDDTAIRNEIEGVSDRVDDLEAIDYDGKIASGVQTYVNAHKEELRGAPGEPGPKGDDGYTPIKGVDYRDGVDGEPGPKGDDGYTPRKGVDYFDGQPGEKGDDGFSPSAKVERVSNGAKIIITDKSGTSEAIVNDGQGGGTADSIDWSKVENKPETYPPSEHNHDDRYYTESEIDDKFIGVNTSLSELERGLPTKITTEVSTYWNAHKSELKGDKGDKGDDGHTPQKGIDYFDGKDGKNYVITDSDYNAIADVVLSKLPSAESEEF